MRIASADIFSRHTCTLTRDAARELDRIAVEELGIPSIVLMENAARGIAEFVLAIGNDGIDRVIVLAGSGNNGGDGLAAARHLHNAGTPVEIRLAAEPSTPDAAANLQICRALQLPIKTPSASPEFGTDFIPPLQPSGARVVILDALLGTGMRGSAREPIAQLITAINTAKERAIVVSTDIPSGLDADTGAAVGPCVRADHTVTLAAPKAGFLAASAGAFIGDVHVRSIGVGPEVIRRLGRAYEGSTGSGCPDRL